ncbi:MAG TPA: hypothetical protein VH277_17540 [Gemmatimonadaceae bacterium]|jgi:predicted nucleotidyltransferase|nr:hypothetical protein [Gemmatimonadaceae bacterium]
MSRKRAWPVLAEPFATALHDAMGFIFDEVEPVGVVATGTIIRGTAHANSDLDLYVVHDEPYRRRMQRFFNGVPAEIFVNPPGAIRRYFAEEHRDGRRITAHMLATGAVVFQDGPIVEQLRKEAREWLARPADMSDFERTSTRYGIATRLEDALDVIDSDETTANLLLGAAVLAMLEYWCRSRDGRIPRSKELIATVRAMDSEIARLADAFSRAATLPERRDLAIALADRTIGARGFFEWDSGPGPAPG